jgi:long-subunit acyl-CoA synthetase (AMP-forming)
METPMDRPPAVKSILDHVYDREASAPDLVYLTQPVGGGEVVDYTWGEVLRQSRCMASYLQGLGLAPGSTIGMLSKNCAHFIMAELAIWMAGYATVAIFPTESATIIRYVLEHSEARLLFVGKLDCWEGQRAGVPDGMPCIALPLAPSGAGAPWNELIAGQPPIAGRPARRDDEMAILTYTSGSTGQPKGVMHSFGGITRAAEGIAAEVGHGPGERYLSYLPLAHVTERAYISCATMMAGGHVFFAESLDTFIADLQRARPTFFISVPRLWLKFQQGVFVKIPARKLDILLRIPILAKLLGRKILANLGLDQVKAAGSGSAPIPAELIVWYRRLGLFLLEGYGMSEDFALSHLSKPELNAPGCVGVPFSGVEVRIGDQGDIQVKSPGRMMGYFKRPDLNAEVFTEDGYFRTGDLGEILPGGLLKVTGRLKELFKTAKGKYVAPAPIENMLNNHTMVELSMVSGVGQPAAYGLVILAEDLRNHLRAGPDDKSLRIRIESSLTALLDEVNGKLSSYEHLQMLVISPTLWTIENGLLTPTMKIRRSAIEAAVAESVPGWYASGRTVVWA